MPDNHNKKDQLTGEQKFHILLHLIDRVASVVMFGLKAAIWIAFAYAFSLVGKEWAGKYTTANIGLKVDGSIDVWIRLLSEIDSTTKWAWLIAIVATLYGVFERKLRQRKTKYFQARIVKLEKRIDENRSSSKLLPTGETRKEDEL